MDFSNGDKIKGDKNPSKRKDVKEILSLKLSGKNNPMYGKKHKIESIEKNKEKNTGENHYLNKLSKIEKEEWINNNLRGKNNPRWKNGISKLPYCPLWTDWYKKIIKERDNYKCQNPLCRMNCNRISIHHIDYDKMNCDEKNLITLCISCNSIANTDREWHKSFYKELIRRKYEDKKVS